MESKHQVSTKTRKKAYKLYRGFPVEEIPSIRRTDIMRGILSHELNDIEKTKLSNLYAEITYMEKRDLKYIREITVSCQSDSEIYDILKKINKRSPRKKVTKVFSVGRQS